MSADNEALMDALRDAAAQDRLLIVTGAGISKDLPGKVRPKLPDWGDLVLELRRQKSFTPEEDALLDRLMPDRLLRKVHGDALIEASEIIKRGYKGDSFVEAVARLCAEKPGTFSDAHAAIASVAPAGIVTFNYDCAHESSLVDCKRDYAKLIYDDDEDIKKLLADRGRRAPFLLKAHGCISRPLSLVLTSSSYRNVLSRHRPYRLFLEHALVSYTVLIVGFALRDRDFEQLLGALEVELGAPVSRHVVTMGMPKRSREGRVYAAHLAAITARFGVEPWYVRDFGKLPDMIRTLASEPGPLLRELVEQAVAGDEARRKAAHDRMELLGETGRAQMRAALTGRLGTERDPAARSELVYSLGKVADGRLDVAQTLLAEIERAVRSFNQAQNRHETECAAHALLAIRRTRTDDAAQRTGLERSLTAPAMTAGLAAMDAFLSSNGGLPRLRVYAEAALAEVKARAEPSR